MNKLRIVPFAVLAMIGGLMSIHPDAVLAQAATQGLLMEVPFNFIEVRIEDELRKGVYLDLVVANSGEGAIEADAVVEGPDGWEASLFHEDKAVAVGRLSLEPGDRIDDLSFHFVLPIGVENGIYTFSLRLLSEDSKVSLAESDFTVLVDIPPEDVIEANPVPERLTGGFEFDARFSYLTGPVGEPVNFRVNIRSRDRRDLAFLLDADTPFGWNVGYKPTFQDAQVRALAVRSGGGASLNVEVTPPAGAAPGVHRVVLRATAEGLAPIEVPLQVELTGIPDLSLTTETSLLTVEATAGEATDLKVLVLNSGDGNADNARFVSIAPPEWVVRFGQNPVPLVEAGGKFQLTVSVTPPDKTVPGDYDVRMITTVDGKSSGLMVRVTVVRSTAFGVIGIGLIVGVVLGLGGLFVRLSRR